MRHGLARLLPDVGHHPVALQAQFLGHLGDDGEDVGHHGGILRGDLRHRCNVGLGNHQEMGGRLGVDVVEGIDRLILIDLVGRNLPGGNLTKQAIRHGKPSFVCQVLPLYPILPKLQWAISLP